jgi:hypothetical protein
LNELLFFLSAYFAPFTITVGSTSKLYSTTMAKEQHVTELVILHLKRAGDLHDVTSETSASGNTAVQMFVQATKIVKAQPGYVRQFWV